MKKKLSDGLDKLKTTNEIVASLKIDMLKLQPQLEEQQVKTEIFMKQLAIDSAEALEVELSVQEEADKVNEQAMEIKIISDEAQVELNKALPALQSAEDALKTINREDINTVRSYLQPVEAVRMVLECVCCFLGEKADWARAKQVMQDGFIDRLQKYDKDDINEKNLTKARVYLKRVDFDLVIIGKASAPCKSLGLWCIAIDNYAKVARKINPLKQRVADMQSKLDEKNRELQQKQKELRKVQEKVQKLRSEYEETLQLKEKLQADLEKTNNRLIAAEKLQDLLADEGIRWKD